MFQSGYVQFFASAMEANAYPLRFIRQSQGVSSTYHLLKISKSSLFPSKAGKTLSSLSFSLSYQIHTNSRQSMSGNSDLRLNLNLIFCLEEFLDTTSDTTFRKIWFIYLVGFRFFFGAFPNRKKSLPAGLCHQCRHCRCSPFVTGSWGWDFTTSGVRGTRRAWETKDFRKMLVGEFLLYRIFSPNRFTCGVLS